MKKIIASLTAILFAAAIFVTASCGSTQNAQKSAQTENAKKNVANVEEKAKLKNRSVAVPTPKSVNLSGDSNWIPLFIQGLLTSNFQKYSGMNVIDRQNADMVKAEQKLSESAEFDEKNAIELGKMTSARFIITGNIMAKSNAYALNFSITDTETGETKASSSIPNCLLSALEDGSAANQISYDLMKSYGIDLSAQAEFELTQKTSVLTRETTAQVSVAKGIVAEQSGANIEALTYYIQAKKNDKKLGEATRRIENMTSIVTSGNFGANAKNLMKLRNDWEKLLRETAEMIAANPPEFELRYFSDIEAEELTEQNYANGTMSFNVGTPYLKQVSGKENEKIATELLNSLHKIEASKNWGEKINGFPWSYADDIGGNNWLQKAKTAKETSKYDDSYLSDSQIEFYSFGISLLDAKKKSIAMKNLDFKVYYEKRYTGFHIVTNDAFLVHDDNQTFGRIEKRISPDRFSFINVSVNDADTEKLYISIQKKEGRDVSILPVSEDVLSVRSALKSIVEGNHNGNIKIGGYASGKLQYSKKRLFSDESYIESVLLLFSLESKAKEGVSKRKFNLDLSDVVDMFVINDSEFSNINITSITLPDCCIYIGHRAFKGCPLETITIPSNVKLLSLGQYFSENGYDSLKAINYRGTKEQWIYLVYASRMYQSVPYEELVDSYEKWAASYFRQENSLGLFRAIKINYNYEEN